MASGIEDEIKDALREAFKYLAAQDVDALYSETAGYSPGEWQNLQLALAAAGGAVGSSLPGAHLAGLAVDLVHLLFRMGRTSMGTGAILGRSRFNDNILGEEDFYAVLAEWSDPGSLHDMVHLKLEAAGGKATVKTLGKVAAKLLAKHAGLMSAGAMAQKLFAKVAGKFVAKLGAKLGLGFIPLVGALVGAGVNAWFIVQINEAAGSFFPRKIKLIENNR